MMIPFGYQEKPADRIKRLKANKAKAIEKRKTKLRSLFNLDGLYLTDNEKQKLKTDLKQIAANA